MSKDEQDAKIIIAVTHLNLKFPDPLTPRESPSQSSTDMRNEFTKFMLEHGKRSLVGCFGWVEAYELCGWDVAYTNNLLLHVFAE